MRQRNVRLDADLEAKESEIFAYYGVQGETYSQQYRDFIVKVHKATRLNEVSQTPDNPAMHPAENITVLRCPLRQKIKVHHYERKTGAKLWTEQKLICVDNPPKYHVLAGIEVCEVCIKKFYGLARKLKAVCSEPLAEPVKAGEKPTEADVDAPIMPAIDLPQATKELFFAHYDKGKHCPFTGNRILKFTCYNCNKQNNDRWRECQTLRASISPTQKKEHY